MYLSSLYCVYLYFYSADFYRACSAWLCAACENIRTLIARFKPSYLPIRAWAGRKKNKKFTRNASSFNILRPRKSMPEYIINEKVRCSEEYCIRSSPSTISLHSIPVTDTGYISFEWIERAKYHDCRTFPRSRPSLNKTEGNLHACSDIEDIYGALVVLHSKQTTGLFSFPFFGSE